MGAGIIAIGPDRYVEVYIVDGDFQLWLVEGESRTYIGETDDLAKVKEIVKKNTPSRTKPKED